MTSQKKGGHGSSDSSKEVLPNLLAVLSKTGKFLYVLWLLPEVIMYESESIQQRHGTSAPDVTPFQAVALPLNRL